MSNHHAPYVLGYTRATMAVTKSSERVTWSETQKSGPSSDCGLQPAHMKSELLVIADQHAAVNAFPCLVHTCLLYTSVREDRGGRTSGEPVVDQRHGRVAACGADNR